MARWQFHHGDEGQDAREDHVLPFAPPVDRDAIFRALICDELRKGRLTKANRARVVQLACGMGLSARRAGELVQECAGAVASEGGDRVHRMALKLAAEPYPHHRVSPFVVFGILGAAALIAHLIGQSLF